MRRCFLHIGTHKTGTTAIQHLLDRNSSALLQTGYIYPRTGRLKGLPGHHNLACEIAGHHRFHDCNGAIDDLITEVKQMSGNIILSSEALGSALHHKSEFSDFISVLKSSGFIVTIIVYFRNQCEYLARLYLTLLHSGLDIPFSRILASTLDRGEFRWQDWIFNSDYCDLLRRLEEIRGVDLIVRSYERSRTSICTDFLSIINLSLQDLHIDGEIYENISLPLREYLLIYLRNRTRRALTESEEKDVNSLVPPGPNRIDLSVGVKLEILRRFAAGNESICNRYGIPKPRLENVNGPHTDQETLCIDKLFA